MFGSLPENIDKYRFQGLNFLILLNLQFSFLHQLRLALGLETSHGKENGLLFPTLNSHCY